MPFSSYRVPHRRHKRLVANSPQSSETGDYPFTRVPVLSKLRPVDRQREFATSVNVDTGGEFSWDDESRGSPFAGLPTLPRLSPIDRPGEFASSIVVGLRPIWFGRSARSWC